jgi:hypothetical protein
MKRLSVRWVLFAVLGVAAGGGVTLLFWSKTSQHFAIAVFAHLTRSGFHKGGPT